MNRDDVVIVAAARTPQGRLKGQLAGMTAVQLGSAAIAGALEKAGIPADAVDAVLVGQVLAAGAGQNPARQAAVGAGIPWTVHAGSVNKVCLSGLTAVIDAARMLRVGDATVVVAAGMESMTRAPHLLAGSRDGWSYGSIEVLDHMAYDGLTDAYDRESMGASTERANARFEVLGRKRLQLQSVTAKDLSAGDQVVLLHDDERAAFSEKLLHLLDQGKFLKGSSTRSSWLSIIRLVRAQSSISATGIKRKLDDTGVCVHVTTVNSWLPSSAEDDCGIPDTLPVFLAFASALGIALPQDTLKQWFADIHRLRVDHRKIGRQLARAIRGAYLSRLDPVTVARMEREWGLQAKMLLEAARVAVVDDVIPFTQ